MDITVPFIHSVQTAFPSHRYSQDDVMNLAMAEWPQNIRGAVRKFYANVGVGHRHFSLPLENYGRFSGFRETNDAWIKTATHLGERVAKDVLNDAGLLPTDIAQLTTTTVTGLAVPTLDARLSNALKFSTSLKRMPLFGLGCVAGVSGTARVADYLKGHPNEAALMLSVELCSLTVQRSDISVANIIASALFGDGAGCVLLVGDAHPLAKSSGPRVVDSLSVFYPNTEKVMGWDMTDTGFKVVLGSDVPEIAGQRIRPALTTFLRQHDLSVSDVGIWLTHPGGPKVIDAIEKSLELSSDALSETRASLYDVGNLSSASVLHVTQNTMKKARPAAGTWGVMIAMGPGFCAEFILLQW